jgi:hypothetical protein
MAGLSGSGVALGLASAEQNNQQRGGGLNMFSIFPKLLIPVILYAIIGYGTVFTNGGDVGAFIGAMDAFQAGQCTDGSSCAVGALNGSLLSIGLPSGDWTISTGDLVLIVALIFLFMEMVQSAGSGTATLTNHGLSIATLLICILLFLLLPVFATSVFFLITMMTLIDVAGGFTITAIAARRDLGS